MFNPESLGHEYASLVLAEEYHIDLEGNPIEYDYYVTVNGKRMLNSQRQKEIEDIFNLNNDNALQQYVECALDWIGL